jgi:NAD(P)-dependent dehydrogenase (short-subunit alcohol dehydrogenase family)
LTGVKIGGRKALVTGGAQGLGEGMAQALASTGARVVVAGSQTPKHVEVWIDLSRSKVGKVLKSEIKSRRQ